MKRYFQHIYLIALIVMGAIALFTGARILYYFFWMLLAIRLSSWLLIRHHLKNIYVRLYSNDSCITTGQPIRLNYRISNTSWLPIVHSRIQFSLDEKMAMPSHLSHIAYFSPQDTLSFQKDMTCEYRGFYTVGQVKITIFDPMMFHRRIVEFDRALDVVVFPRIVKLPDFLYSPKAQEGTLKARDRSIDDRTHILNVRNFQRGDALKNIHWKLSAKRDELMTREFHKTMSSRLKVYLDGFKGNFGGSFNLDQEERMVSFCASYLKSCTDHGLQYTLTINNQQVEQIQGERSVDFSKTLELLTAFQSNSLVTFNDFMRQRLMQSSSFEHLIFIVPLISPDFRHFLSSLNHTYQVYTFACDPEDMVHYNIQLIQPLMGDTHDENA